MRQTSAFALFFLGLVMTFGAVGSIETTLTTEELLAGLSLALVGLGLMGVGVLGLRSTVDNQD